MASVFISCAHLDRGVVQRMRDAIESAGHHPVIDDSFLNVGDSITLEIRDHISKVDYVAVLISKRSAQSDWVEQEILETLYHELKSHKVKLIPCKLDDCQLPNALTRLKRFGRRHEDLSTDMDAGLERLVSRLARGSSDIFVDEQFIKLDLPVTALDIFLTGEPWNWQTNQELRYEEMIDGYLLYGFRMDPWTHFKHFVLCEERDASRVRGKLQSFGFDVTGTGDKDPATKKRRVWFRIPGYPVDGGNNQWPE